MHYSFNQVIVGNLGKQMVDNMCANIMMDVVNDSIIAVNCCQSSPQITPFLQNDEWNDKHILRQNVILEIKSREYQTLPRYHGSFLS